MQIRPRSRSYLLFIAVLNLLIFACLLTGVLFVGFAESANLILSGIFVAGALYALRNALIFGLAWLRHPHFCSDVSPGSLSIGTRGQELRIGSSDVLAYYVYNNKVLIRARALSGQPSILPFARIRNGQVVVIYLYLIADPAEFLRALRLFDVAFQDKLKVNAGMVIQALGNV